MPHDRDLAKLEQELVRLTKEFKRLTKAVRDRRELEEAEKLHWLAYTKALGVPGVEVLGSFDLESDTQTTEAQKREDPSVVPPGGEGTDPEGGQEGRDASRGVDPPDTATGRTRRPKR